MIQEVIILLVQIIAAFGVVVSVFYLGVQVKQQNAITKAQFGFSLTQRLYDRFFQTATNPEFCDLLSLDWAEAELSNQQRWQVGFYINTLLVDIFDTYDKTEAGFVDANQLAMRMNLLRTGMMRLPQGKMLWNLWKPTRSEIFITWFEHEIYDGDDLGGFDLRKSDGNKSLFR
tara:strand:- start:287 stop:805 length:519 start_codon:yes stop_codon:yes gene_type:complete